MLNSIAKLFFFFFPGSTASRTLNAGTGSFAFTGHDAVLTLTEVEVGGYSSRRRKVRVRPPVIRRAYALQGEPTAFAFESAGAELKRSYGIRAQTGTASVTGKEAALGASRVLRAEGGTVSFAGSGPSVTRHAAIIANGGRYVIIGAVATMTRGVDVPAKMAAEDDEFLILMEAA